MKVLYFADQYVGDKLFVPCFTCFVADDDNKEDFDIQMRNHFKQFADKITNEQIDANVNCRVRLALVGDIYKPGNYGCITCAEIFDNNLEAHNE